MGYKFVMGTAATGASMRTFLEIVFVCPKFNLPFHVVLTFCSVLKVLLLILWWAHTMVL